MLVYNPNIILNLFSMRFHINFFLFEILQQDCNIFEALMITDHFGKVDFKNLLCLFNGFDFFVKFFYEDGGVYKTIEVLLIDSLNNKVLYSKNTDHNDCQDGILPIVVLEKHLNKFCL